MSDTTVRAGNNPGTIMVSADQVTILGNGTPSAPLRLAGAAQAAAPNTFEASFIPDLPLAPVPGMIVAATPEVPEPGLSISVKAADAGAGGFPVGIGMITAVDVSASIPRVIVQTSGFVTKSPAEWDAFTGLDGGLEPGATYYLSANLLGNYRTEPPSASETFIAEIGVALNAVTLLLSLPAVPRQNP